MTIPIVGQSLMQRIATALGRCRRAGMMLACLGVLVASPCAARPRVSHRPEPAMHGFRTLPYEQAKLDSLQHCLEVGALDLVPGTMFGPTQDGSLPDLIFYFGATDGDSKVALVQDGKPIRKLHSARYVWAMVFFEGEAIEALTKRTESEAKPKSLSLPKGYKAGAGGSPDTVLAFDVSVETSGASVRLEPLDFHRGVVESTVLGGLATVLGGAVPKTETTAPKDETQPLRFTRLSPKGDPHPLYYGYVKFGIQELTVNRIRVALGEERRGYATFPNYSSSSTGLSLAALVRAPASHRTGWRETTLESYLLFHLYALRPELPRLRGVSRPMAFGAFAGLGIGSDALKRPALGLTVDHIFGELGFVGGVSYRREAGADKHDRWTSGYLFGLSYTL